MPDSHIPIRNGYTFGSKFTATNAGMLDTAKAAARGVRRASGAAALIDPGFPLQTTEDSMLETAARPADATAAEAERKLTRSEERRVGRECH